MSDEALKKLEAIEKKIDLQNAEIKEIKDFIGNRDRVKNSEYCNLRKITRRTLEYWFIKGCPKEDARHVSIKAVDDWARKNNTRVPLDK
jgi:hypothetical protein